MRFTPVALSTLLVFSEITTIAAKAITFQPRGLQKNRGVDVWGGLARRALEVIEKDILLPREPQPQAASTISSASSSITASAVPSSNDATQDSSSACVEALSAITNLTGPAGIAACYNVLYLDNETGVFESELQLYNMSQPSGTFAGVKFKDIQIALSYPDGAATISSMSQKMKRAEPASNSSADTLKQDSSMTQLSDRQFIGQLDKTLQLSKLNTTDMMALVIPTISLSAISPSTEATVKTNLNSSDIMYFVTGLFAGQSAVGAAAASPAAALAAKDKAAGFILPGTTFGIFPTALIVTASWTVLFITAFGLGTIGRIRHRNNFRKRKAALGKK